MAGGEALLPLLAAYRRDMGSRVLFTELRNLSDTAEWRPALEAGGFVYEEHLNFLIDLTRSPETIWPAFAPMPGATFRRRSARA